MTATIVPARVHGKTHARNHARIQKKWNKRFGVAQVQRESADGLPRVRLDNPMPALGRRARGLQSSLRRAHPWTEAELKAANDAKLLTLCDRMVATARAEGHDSVTFNCADQAEADFIRAYMTATAPALIVTSNVRKLA